MANEGGLCGDCIHCFDANQVASNGNRIGVCKRVPPYPIVLDNRVRFKQPTVLIDFDWCSELERYEK